MTDLARPREPTVGDLATSLPKAVLSWCASMLEEMVRAPATLRDARTVLAELGRVPEQVEAFGVLLDKTTVTLDAALGELSGMVGGQMRDTLANLDRSVSDLRDTLIGVVGVIPGARRALQGAARLPREPS